MFLYLAIAGSVLVLSVFGFPHMVKRVEVRRLAAQCRSKKLLALTFDDGPGRVLTQELLAELRSHGVRATFFSLGRRASQSPEILDQVARDGHEIGSHGFYHYNAWKVLPGKALADIRRGFASLAAWVPRDGLFRPPHGKTTLFSLLALKMRGATICWWTHDGGDTWTTLPPIDEMARRILNDRGGVVLLHDFDRTGDESRVAERGKYVCNLTSKLIEGAKEAGIQLTTVGELLALRRSK